MIIELNVCYVGFVKNNEYIFKNQLTNNCEVHYVKAVKFCLKAVARWGKGGGCGWHQLISEGSSFQHTGEKTSISPTCSEINIWLNTC